MYDWNDIDFAGDCVYLTNRHLVDHLTKDTPAMNSAAKYLVNLQIEQAVYQSASSATKIDPKV